MVDTPVGKLGTIDVVLASWAEKQDQYQRRYIPISTQGVFGDDDASVEREIIQWVIDDWSGGDGDVKWQDRGRYRSATGCGPASDGSGLVVGAGWTATASIANNSRVVVRGGGRMILAGEMDAALLEWNGSAWVTLWGVLGGAAADFAVAAAAVDSSAWFVLDDDGDIRKVTSGGNTAHYTGGLFDDIVAYDGLLYGLVGADLYLIDTSAATTRTIKSDSAASLVNVADRTRLLRTSDVGVIWIAPTDDGRTLMWEYNVYADVAFVMSELPKDVFVYDLMFYNGVYLATFRAAPDHTSVGEAYLWYRLGQATGVMGPYLASGSTASLPVVLPGVIGDRIYTLFDHSLWAYDITTGAILKVAKWTSGSTT